MYLPCSTLQYFVNKINHVGSSLRCEFICARVGKFSWLPAKVNELVDRERQCARIIAPALTNLLVLFPAEH